MLDFGPFRGHSVPYTVVEHTRNRRRSVFKGKPTFFDKTFLNISNVPNFTDSLVTNVHKNAYELIV